MELDQNIKGYRANEGIVSVQDQKQGLFGLIDKLKERLEIAIIDLDQGRGKIAEIERQIKNLPKFTVTSQEIVDPEAKMLHEKLVALELEKTALLQKYTEKDRRVEDKAKEIETIKERLAAGAGKKVIVGERISQNTVYQTLENELMDQKVKLGQVQAKRESLLQQLKLLNGQLAALDGKGNKLALMEESLAKRKELLLLYSKKAEEARITAAMDREQLINVKIVDYSRDPIAPVSAGAALSLVLAAIVGIGGGIGGALGLEYLRPTFHSALDAQRHLQLQVLAVIPDMREKA
jgi:chromosome segregation ATPase